MLDARFIREHPKDVRESMKKRGMKTELVDEWLKLDERLRKLRQENDGLRHKRNVISEEINRYKKTGNEKAVQDSIKEAKDIPGRIKKIDDEIMEVERNLNKILFNIPNIVDKKVPLGNRAEKNRLVKKTAVPKIKNAVSHVEILENLGLMDLKASAKIAGEGFYVMKNELAVLERALINFMLDFHKKQKRTECSVPVLVNEKSAFGTAHLPKFENDMYKTTEGLYLIPTAELPLTNLHQDSVLSETELPLRYCAYTPCFRTEAGKHGTETRGLFRLHQFDKVEMVTICKPEQSEKELNMMVNDAEKLLKMLKIPYRILVLCSLDIGFASSITYDIETWSPFLKKYMETSSVSNCKDFQARRMNTKFLRKKKNEREFVHTLNGSGLALPRLMIALAENNQQKDGSIKIPAVLHKYCGFKVIKARSRK